MLYVLTGMLKPGVEAQLVAHADAFNEHLSQPFQRILIAGALRGRDNERKGFMLILEAESYERAEAFLQQSPLFRADLYERVDVSAYAVQLGRLE